MWHKSLLLVLNVATVVTSGIKRGSSRYFWY